VYAFGNGGHRPTYFISSADWMPRNLDRRVEAIVPIDDVQWHRRLHAVLETCLSDNRQAWELGADGVYRRRERGEGPERATHRILLRDSWGTHRDTAAWPLPSSPIASPKSAGRPPSSSMAFLAITDEP
jgi:polyphosphate kinase